MPITITPVGPHGFVGPGIPINISIQPPGGIPPGAFIDFGIYTDLEGANPILRQTRVSQVGPSVTWTPLVNFSEPAQAFSFTPQAGDQVRVIVKLMEGTTQIDSGAISVPWQEDEGLYLQNWLLAQQLNAKSTTGLTPTQDTNLTLASQSTAAARMSIGPAALIGYALNQLAQLDQVPYYFLCSVDATNSISGTGELVVPQLLRPFYTAGLSWQFTRVPAGMGRMDGASVTWQQRVLQTVVRYRLHGSAGPVLDQAIGDWHNDQLIYLFDPPLPLSVAYYIAPGCEVKFFWLQVCVPP